VGGLQGGGIRDFPHLLRTLSNFSRSLDSSLRSRHTLILVSSHMVIILLHNIMVRGDQYEEQRPRPHNNQAPRPRGAAPVRQRQGEDQAKGGDNHITMAEQLGDETEKQSKVICFNCAEWGHYSSECKQPRLCFVCQTTEHVGRECPEWQKPITVA
jgi:hypothetical protein